MDRHSAKGIEQIRADMKELAEGLCTSPVKTFDEYKYRVGQYVGMQDAIDTIKKAHGEEHKNEH